MNFQEYIEHIIRLKNIETESLNKYHSYFSDTLNGIRKEIKEGVVYSFWHFLNIQEQILEVYILLLERVEKLIKDLNKGKISKTYLPFLNEQSNEIRILSDSLKDEFYGTLQTWEEIFPEIDYDGLSEELIEYIGFLDRSRGIGIELSNIIKKYSLHEDGEYYYFQSEQTTVDTTIRNLEDITMILPLESELYKSSIQISKFLMYNPIENIFINISNKKEYRISGNGLKFMKKLIEKGGKGNYVNYNDFTKALGLSRYDEDTSDFEQNIPSATQEAIRTTYRNIQKAIIRKFGYLNKKDADFCGPAKGGFRIAFLGGN